MKRRIITLILAIAMIITSMPLDIFANSFRYHDIPSEMYNYINNMPVDKPAKLGADPTTKEEANAQIAYPEYPKTYTMETDFKVRRGDRLETNFQPYIATVGDESILTTEEKNKISYVQNLPELDGYTRPTPSLNINYNYVKDKAANGIKVETNPRDIIFENSKIKTHEFKYNSIQVPITIKHVFQNLYDKTKYNGSPEISRQQYAQVGHNMVVSPLPENERIGFEPESNMINVQVPENPKDFVVEYRYNRAKYAVSYNTSGGSDIPAQVLYYGQTIPAVPEPKKKGATFKGWKASNDIIYKNESNEELTIKAGTLIANKNSEFKEGMPAQNLVFTAEWQENPKADYTILYYTEKPDHEFGNTNPSNLREKYDFVGARVIKDAATGSKPNLEEELPIGVTFPDLEGDSANIVNNKEELNKYYIYNAATTKKVNEIDEDMGDGTIQKVQKKIESTGETVYEVYYDRTVYTLIFERVINGGRWTTFDPEITVYDTKTGKTSVYDYVKGTEDHGKEPYSITARFGESLASKWVRDGNMGEDYTKNIFKGDKMAYISKGYLPRRYSQGWKINKPRGSDYRDTPPYRLTKSEFIDVDRTKVSPSRKEASGNPIKYDDKTISLGIAMSKLNKFMPHHVEFELEGLDGVYRFHPELYYWKSDTDTQDYTFPAPKLKGFTAPGKKRADIKDEAYFRHVTTTRPEGQKTPFAFQKNLMGVSFKINGHIPFRYTRNSFTLYLNSDPTTVKEEAYYTGKVFSDGSSQSEPVKYEKPLVDVDLPVLTDNDKPESLRGAEFENYKFMGWALDPSGVNMVQNAKYIKNGENTEVVLEKNPQAKETMPDYNVTLYAVWGEEEPDWEITFDPNGGTLTKLQPSYVATHKAGELVQTTIGKKEYIMPEIITDIGYNNSENQVVRINHRLTIKDPLWKPKRDGHDFLGWELVRYNKDGTENNDYKDKYSVPELYAFQNEVVKDAYLRAIWVPNDLVPVVAVHHFYDDTGNKIREPIINELAPKRVGSYTSAVASEQGAKYILLDENANELDKIELYKEIHKKTDRSNVYFQTMKVQNPKMEDPENPGTYIDNPDAFNEFHFFYRKFKTRKYKINYFDDRIKNISEPTEEEIIKYRIINKNSPEVVENGNKHFDARNYRRIPGWKLVSAPQQQLFFDLDGSGNFLGINGTGSDEINFYYQDIRVIEREDSKSVVPDGYRRVIFKIDPDKNGGSFGTKADGTPRTEIVYDVIDGLYSDNIPVPKVLADGETEVAGKTYIKPDPGKKFLYWDNSKLFNRNTIIQRDYEFTAYFDWAGLQIKGLVRTESLTGKNEFVPTTDELKAALTWVSNGVEGPLPNGINVTITDKQDAIYEKVKELNKTDSDELVRTVEVNAKVDYGNGSVQVIKIPIKIYKNRYDALTTGNKPNVLVEGEKSDLKNITGAYVKVTVNPTGKPGEKDSKIYYVNPKALVDIPEINLTDAEKQKLGFTNWTADKNAQNEEQKENGIFDFAKRHKFTEDTVISPGFAKDVVPQEGTEKPKVPANYVKVIVNKTDKAVLGTNEKQEEIFWVNPTKEVTIPVTNPAGKTVDADATNGNAKGYTLQFNRWQSKETNARKWENTIVGTFENETTIEAKYSIQIEKLKEQMPTKDTVHTPQGKTPTADDYKNKITPPDGKTIASVEIVENPDVNNPGETKAKVIINYTDGSSVGTNNKPVEIPVKVHDKIIPAKPGGERPEGALENYVKVNFVAGEGGTLSGNTIYYVSPEVEVDMTDSANGITKTPSVGYTSNGGTWSPTIESGMITEEKTYTFNFVKSNDIVEKTTDNPDKPEGYVIVIFKAAENGQVEGGDKTYFVNPNANIKLVKTATPAATKELVVPGTTPNENYSFEKWVEEIDYTNPITGNREHVAHFTKGKVTLTYNANGGSGDAPEEQSVYIGEKIQLAYQGNLAKENSSFLGWKFSGDEKIYKPGETITLTESKTAIAQWSTNSHTVRFETKGGSNVDDVTVTHGNTIGTVTTPTFDDKVFMGWKINESDPNYFDIANTPINEDKTLVAIWQKPVQEIRENDSVEEDKFIKVTFNKGNHGELKLGENVKVNFFYKVDKNLTFNQAVDKGMAVPQIVPANYYKSKAENQGWDKSLELNGNSVEFIAQYEPIADVIPIEEIVTPDEKIEENRPDNYVVVRFIVDESKAFMTETSKFYVAKNKEVTFKAPVAYNKIKEVEFNGWTDTPLSSDGNLTRTFDSDTDIVAKGIETPEIEIKLPRAGESIINILSDLNGAVGKVELMENGISKIIDSQEKTVTTRRGRRQVTTKYVLFEIGRPLLEGEIIKYWVEKDGAISDVREYTVK